MNDWALIVFLVHKVELCDITISHDAKATKLFEKYFGQAILD